MRENSAIHSSAQALKFLKCKRFERVPGLRAARGNGALFASGAGGGGGKEAGRLHRSALPLQKRFFDFLKHSVQRISHGVTQVT